MSDNIFDDLPIVQYKRFSEYEKPKDAILYDANDFIMLYTNKTLTYNKTVMTAIIVNGFDTNIQLANIQCEWEMEQGFECVVNFDQLQDLALVNKVEIALSNIIVFSSGSVC